jgi:transcriptional regulator with GAF, ATPase, and Fis domain
MKLRQSETIKNQDILSIISEISETLSLTNNPKQLLETTLDTLSEVLNTDCCWVQLVKLSSGKLPLVSCRGLTADMQRKLASIDMEHRFSHEIVGLGHKIIINNLSRDGNYEMSLFEKAGFCSLIAVPIMTYRVHGILGMAYRARKKFGRDYADLIAVIASLIGMSLNKAILHRQSEEKHKPPDVTHAIPQEPDIKNQGTQSVTTVSEDADTGVKPQSRKKKQSNDFQDHVRRMRTFNNAHRPQ